MLVLLAFARTAKSQKVQLYAALSRLQPLSWPGESKRGKLSLVRERPQQAYKAYRICKGYGGRARIIQGPIGADMT